MKVVITGTVGVGKSSVIEKLKTKRPNYLYREEWTLKSPLLEKYYKNGEKWLFLSHMDFLITRFKTFLEDRKEKETIIYDRHFIDSLIFFEVGKNYFGLKKTETKIWDKIHKDILEKLKSKKIDYVIILKNDLDIISKRVEQRNRKIEQNAGLFYWHDLYNAYYKNKKTIKLFKKLAKNVIILDTKDKTVSKITKEVLNIIEEKG